MDERVHLTHKVNGATEFQISGPDLHDLGADDFERMEALTREIQAQGVNPANLGEPKFMQYRNSWVIPVRMGN